MNTSYYASPRIIGTEYKYELISISKKPPAWFTLPHKIYKPLCPSWKLVMNYKSGQITKEQYTQYYHEEILDSLDPARTYQELGENAVLLCWEKSNQFCHRHIVAKWLMDNLNIEITEL